MVALTFPDGARREYPQGTTGLDIAKGISPSLAKRTVAMALDGVVTDLADPIEKNAKLEFLTREDPRALELIRHDAAHVMAEAEPDKRIDPFQIPGAVKCHSFGHIYLHGPRQGNVLSRPEALIDHVLK